MTQVIRDTAMASRCLTCRKADALDVAMIGAAAAADDGDVRMAFQQLAVLRTSSPVPGRLGEVVELGIAATRQVGAVAQTLHPRRILLERTAEMRRVSAVDHVVRGSNACRSIHGVDGFRKLLACRQTTVGLDVNEITQGISASSAAQAKPIPSLMLLIVNAETRSAPPSRNRPICHVIVLRLVQTHDLAGVVAVAARPDVAADDDGCLAGLAGVAQGEHEIERGAIDIGKARAVVTDLGSPIGIGSPCGAFEHEAAATLLGDGNVALVAVDERGASLPLSISTKKLSNMGRLQPSWKMSVVSRPPSVRNSLLLSS